MVRRKLRWGGVIGLVVTVVIVAAGCTATPEESARATAGCTTCHNDTTLVFSKRMQSNGTTHMTGRGWSYAGARASCTACHSSEGFQEMVATSMGIENFKEATPNPSPQNCRTCHQIHTTYTRADFALKTTAPVILIG